MRYVKAFSGKMKESRIVVVRPVSVTPVSVINGVRKIKQTLICTALPIQRSESSPVAGFTMHPRQINGVIEKGVLRQLQFFVVTANLLVVPLKRRRIGESGVTEPEP